MTEYVREYIATCEAYGWEGGPRFRTRIVQKANGRERRNADWSQPQHEFSVPFQNITQEQYVPISTMFMNRKGAWGVFLFDNKLDNEADDEVFATAGAGEDTFQLSKWSVVDGVPYQRNVYALYVPDTSDPGDMLPSDITVTVDGSPTTAFTLDRDRGIIVFDSPLSGGEVLRWSGGFSLWVRFASDNLPFSIDNRSGDQYVVNGSVGLIEMPPPDEIDS